MSGLLWFSLLVLVSCLSIQEIRIALMSKNRAHAHDVLLKRVMRLRLYKMLKFLGVNQDEYLRAVPAADINQQIHRCTHCKALDICDSCLRDGKRIVNMKFCPNHTSLIEQSNTIHLYRRR